MLYLGIGDTFTTILCQVLKNKKLENLTKFFSLKIFLSPLGVRKFSKFFMGLLKFQQVFFRKIF